jgi:HK97 family phage major capsid protein
MSIRDGNGNYVFRAEMLNGTLWGFPYKTTTLVPTNLGSGSDSEIYLVDFADAVYGDTMRMSIEAFDQMSYTDPSTGNLVSAGQRDQTVIRAITEHDFGMRHDASVAILTGVAWA